MQCIVYMRCIGGGGGVTDEYGGHAGFKQSVMRTDRLFRSLARAFTQASLAFEAGTGVILTFSSCVTTNGCDIKHRYASELHDIELLYNTYSTLVCYMDMVGSGRSDSVPDTYVGSEELHQMKSVLLQITFFPCTPIPR